jgi:acetyl-CoA acetyltransferase
MTTPRFRGSGQVAIAGYAQSPITRHIDEPLGTLAIKTALKAIADAGLTKEQVDGFTTGAIFPSSGGRTVIDGTHIVTSDWLAEQLGIRPRWLCGFQGVGQIPGSVILAATAIATGAADYVLVHRAMFNPPGRYHENPMTEADGDSQWNAPQGYWSPIAQAALPYMEYMQRYGARREDMATVVVEARRNGAAIPWSYWHDRPITVDDYMEARMIADPISLLDCDLPISGVGAFVLTSAERARPPNGIGYWSLDEIHEAGTEMAGHLWESAGLSRQDVDIPQLYDGFSPFVYFWLEALGYCPRGEAHRFVQDGGLRPGTGHPFLSGGGALGNGRMHGVPQMLECYLQLSRRAGERQLDQAEVALACQATPNFGGAVLYSSHQP